MLLLQGQRYRCYPVGAEHEVFARWFSCCRFVKNWSKRRRGEAWEKEGKSLGYQDLAAELPGLKLLHPWLCEVPNQILQQALIDSDIAFQRFFRKEAGYPDWARRFEDDSARFPACVQRQRVFDENGDVKLDADGKEVWRETTIIDLGQDSIDLPKIGRVRWSKHRPLAGKPKSVTLTLEGGQYYISVTCEVEVPDPVFSTPFVAEGDAIRVDADLMDYLSDGLDFGVVRNWCNAQGGVFDVPGWRPGEDVRKLKLKRGIGRQEEARKEREKEARERGLLTEGQRLPQSKRQMKRRRNLSALQGRFKRRNRNAIHKFTTKKAKSHGLIGLEGLRIKNMTASAAGTTEEPGTNVAAKAALNREILSASPGFTKTLMRYKGERYGCLVVLVPPAYTSQYCSRCRRHPKDDAGTKHLNHGRISQAEFVCPLCGHAMNADHNAAINIRYGALVLAGWVEDKETLERLGAQTVAEEKAEKAENAGKLAARKARAPATKAATLERKRLEKKTRIVSGKAPEDSGISAASPRSAQAATREVEGASIRP